MKKYGKSLETTPDFYNILLERHYDDPDGYDVLIIDPIVKGNYGSRLSHSCNPNCGTVSMVSEGKYTIGMYALKDINYLEELTFDYNSFTESKEEHLKSVCLCSSSICNSYYLALAKNSKSIPDSNTFLHRIALLLKASRYQFSDKDSEICSKYYVRSAIMDGCPEWLKAWIALIVREIDNEVNSKISMVGKKMTIDSRLQSLAITVDKVKYCMKRTSFHCPVSILDKSQALDYIWGDNSKSIKHQLHKLNQKHNLDLGSLITVEISDLQLARLQLLKVRDRLRLNFPNK